MNPRTELAVSAAIRDFNGVLGLFGDPGSGKMTIAKHIIGSLTQRNPDTIAAWAYFRLLDGSSSGIESVRELQKFLQLKVPGDTPYKRAVILDGFDNTSAEAQNALLKTIEEPPADTLIILTATSEVSIMSTILSRITRVPVLPVPKNEAIHAVGLGSSNQEIDKLYNLAEGRIGLFVALVNGDVDRTEVASIELAKELLRLKKPERLSRIDSLIKSKDVTPIELVEGLLKIYRALMNGRIDSSVQIVEIQAVLSNLIAAHEAMSDLKAGVHSKLVLTRLFIARG